MLPLPKRPLLALALIVGTAWACTADAPVAPEARDTAPRFSHAGGDAPELGPIARFTNASTDTLKIGIAMKWICSEGGSLQVFGFEAVVPAGAVSECTRFKIRLSVDAQRTNDHVIAEFTPHGVHFAEPVTLRVPYAGTTAEGTEARVLWWDGSGWVPSDTRYLEDGRAETLTDHFSTWGMEASEGIIVAGG